MKKSVIFIGCIVAIALISLVVSDVWVYRKPAVTYHGYHWLNGTEADKRTYVIQTSEKFKRWGIPVELTHKHYVPMMDRFLQDYPEFTSKNLGDIFVNLIYESEPSARPAIESSWSDFRGNWRA